jgi:hypothetical protein
MFPYESPKKVGYGYRTSKQVSTASYTSTIRLCTCEMEARLLSLNLMLGLEAGRSVAVIAVRFEVM